MRFRIVNEAKQIQCPECEGEGKIPIGDHFVTHEMAIDAGDRSLEGQYYKTEYGTCPKCGGNGFLIVEQTLSGAGYPAATDAAGGQAIDKAPTSLAGTEKKAKRKKRIKSVMARRVLPKV
jgi:hypothetical protein